MDEQIMLNTMTEKKGVTEWEKERGTCTETLNSGGYFKLDEITKNQKTLTWESNTEINKHRQSRVFPFCEHFRILFWKPKAVFCIQNLIDVCELSTFNRIS